MKTRHYFRNEILKKNHVWVVEIDHRPAAFMAMENDFIDQLYVHPKLSTLWHWKSISCVCKEQIPRTPVAVYAPVQCECTGIL